MPGCEKKVFWLKDHLIRIHDYDFEDGKAEGATSQFGLCSKRERTVPSEKQRHYKRRFCPVKNCFKILVRLENHLHSVHDIQDEEEFQEYLRKATYVNEEIENKNDQIGSDHDSEADEELQEEKEWWKRQAERKKFSKEEIENMNLSETDESYEDVIAFFSNSTNYNDDDDDDIDDFDWLKLSLAKRLGIEKEYKEECLRSRGNKAE